VHPLHPAFQIAGHGTHLGLEIGGEPPTTAGMARPVVAHQVSNDLLDFRPSLAVGLERIALVVGARGVYLLAVIAEENDAVRLGTWFLAAALCPQRAVVALSSIETEPPAFQLRASIGDTGLLAVGTGQRASILREVEVVRGKQGRALFIRQQRSRELRLPVADLAHQGTGLATAGGGVISEAASASSLDGVRS